MTFAVAACGGMLALSAWRVVEALRLRQSGGTSRVASNDGGATRTGSAGTAMGIGPRTVATIGIAIAGLAIVPLGLAVPLHAPDGRPVQVAMVQGNVPRLGLEFNAQRRAVLDNHVRATLALAAQVAAGRAPKPDIVIWPENSSDIDPLVADDPGNADAATEITAAANTIGAPILVGAVLEGPGAHRPQRVHRVVARPDRRPAVRAARNVRQAAPGAVRRVHADARRGPAGSEEG